MTESYTKVCGAIVAGACRRDFEIRDSGTGQRDTDNRGPTLFGSAHPGAPETHSGTPGDAGTGGAVPVRPGIGAVLRMEDSPYLTDAVKKGESLWPRSGP
jgi:hypothetical protein